MAKKVTALIKLQVFTSKATPAPPIGAIFPLRPQSWIWPGRCSLCLAMNW